MSKIFSNPPLYYSLVQAQFNHVVAMDSYIDKIQDKFRLEGYTIFVPEKVSQLYIDSGLNDGSSKAEIKQIPVWRFTKSDRKSGFLLHQNQLIFHTTHYETHENFFNDFTFGLEILNSVVKLEHLSRLGLRYLNAIIPKENEEVEKYLNDGLHGIKLDIKPRYVLHESVYDTSVEGLSSTLVNRSFRRFGPLGFPPDINPPDLISLQKFSNFEIFIHVVIDLDHFVIGQMSLESALIKSRLNLLHKEIKTIFNLNLTDYAKSVWDQ